MNRCRSKSAVTILILGVWISIIGLMSCGEDANPVDPNGNTHPGPDTTAPAAVVDLRLRSPTQQTLALVWTSPGDDGTKGTASRYDIRFSKAMITDTTWDQATPVAAGTVPNPKPAGQVETIVVTGLASGTTYYFALKTSDEVPNESGLSNCCHEKTAAETNPPGDITDLRAAAVDATSFELTWTAPGDDYKTGTATRYDIRYSVRPVTNEDEWNRALVVADPPSPKPAGASESFTVSGLTAKNYFFVIKTADELDNWSQISNQAIGLGYGEILWAFPSWIGRGETMYIAYRATSSDFTRVSLHNGFYWWEDRACGSKLVMDLVCATLPEGVHTLEFDFVDPETGEYFASGYYEIFLCYGPDFQKYLSVSFD